ncbi:MAG: 16S rRNA (cytosine(1402)-N(4))-methyltransferase RsmH [Nitrospirae bacterium]|nr:MAG: 16S rRNA (cytosine(1402)-N(4))-methyltransferase RsmH [Nitrospirota bacterium]
MPGEHEKDLHIPVLAEEVVAGLGCKPGGRYVDCTVGYGGHAALILERSAPDGVLIGMDQDEAALRAAGERLQPYAGRVRLVRGNFQELKQQLRSMGVAEVDGVMFDLGVSSAQLDEPTRGFSFLADGPLDMRMDQRAALSAASLVNDLPEQELADLIYRYGEERYSRRIARAIVRARAIHPLARTLELASVIRGSVPPPYRHGRIHCATRTFQALRIAVNRELDVLEGALKDAVEVLAPGGRLCVISFHSLEDRIAKQTFRALSRGESPCLSVLTKRPLVASEEERAGNPRARSAKLRVAERLTVGRAA